MNEISVSAGNSGSAGQGGSGGTVGRAEIRMFPIHPAADSPAAYLRRRAVDCQRISESQIRSAEQLEQEATGLRVNAAANTKLSAELNAAADQLDPS